VRHGTAAGPLTLVSAVPAPAPGPPVRARRARAGVGPTPHRTLDRDRDRPGGCGSKPWPPNALVLRADQAPSTGCARTCSRRWPPGVAPAEEAARWHQGTFWYSPGPWPGSSWSSSAARGPRGPPARCCWTANLAAGRPGLPRSYAELVVREVSPAGRTGLLGRFTGARWYQLRIRTWRGTDLAERIEVTYYWLAWRGFRGAAVRRHRRGVPAAPGLSARGRRHGPGTGPERDTLVSGRTTSGRADRPGHPQRRLLLIETAIPGHPPKKDRRP